MPTAQLTNDQARASFLRAAVKRSQILPRQNFDTSNPTTITFNLPKAGFGRFCIIDFQGTMKITGAGGSIALSSKAPWNVLSNETFIDYLGITRHSVSGHQLYERDMVQKWGFDPSNSVLSQSGISAFRYEAGIGGGNGAAGNYPWQFSWMVPISLKENDTRGSFPFAVADGTNSISLTVNPSLVGSDLDSVIVQSTAGFTLELVGTFGCKYYYWDVPKGTPIPVEDFSLVHELRGLRDTTNLQAGQEKRYALQTGRTYYQVIENLCLNGALDTLNINEIRFIVDGNTPTMDEDLMGYLSRTYSEHNRDFPAGLVYYNFWEKPWTPANYGSLETGLTLANSATTTGKTYLDVFMEAVYQTSKILQDLATGLA